MQEGSAQVVPGSFGLTAVLPQYIYVSLWLYWQHSMWCVACGVGHVASVCDM